MSSYHPISSGMTSAAFLGCLMIAGGFFVTAIFMRFKQVNMAGRDEVRWDNIPARISNVITYVLLQKRLPRNGYLYSGILHMFIFGAFVVLSVDTINFVSDGLFKVLAVQTNITSERS